MLMQKSSPPIKNPKKNRITRDTLKRNDILKQEIPSTSNSNKGHRLNSHKSFSLQNKNNQNSLSIKMS